MVVGLALVAVFGAALWNLWLVRRRRASAVLVNLAFAALVWRAKRQSDNDNEERSLP